MSLANTSSGGLRHQEDLALTLVYLFPPRPFLFSSIFQSAPAVASYVANAIEAGAAWPRIERFFLSCVEADPSVAGMKVQISGRMGERASGLGAVRGGVVCCSGQPPHRGCHGSR